MQICVTANISENQNPQLMVLISQPNIFLVKGMDSKNQMALDTKSEQ